MAIPKPIETNLADYFQYYNKSEIEGVCRGVFESSKVDLHSIFADAMKLTLEYAKSKPPHYVTRNTLPLQMYDNVIGILYDSYSDMMHLDKEGCPYLLLSPDIRVYPKKLNSNYVPGNIVTNHVKEKRGQLLFYDNRKIHLLYVGPVLEKEDWMIDVKGFYASFINEYYPKKPEFIIDLKEYIKTPIVKTDYTSEEQPLVRIAKKRDKQDEGL